jgi:S1-C subfamily serine protease
MLDDATLVRVGKAGGPARATARTVLVDREANLALLTVDEPEFFRDLTPARLDSRPLAAGEVQFARWSNLQFEVTAGDVVRVELGWPTTGSTARAITAVNTQMQGGGWAEPVFRGKRVVGLVWGQSRNIASVLPMSYIEPWVQDARDGEIRPHAHLGANVQDIDDRPLAEYLGLTEPKGVWVREVLQGRSACGVVRAGDVILEVGGFPLDGEGNVQDPVLGKIGYPHVLSSYRAGDTLDLRLWRDSAVVDVEVPLRHSSPAGWLIPRHRSDPPAYAVQGGLVFRELDDVYPGSGAAVEIIRRLEPDTATPEKRRVIVLSSVLPDPYNLGYHTLRDLPILSVNDQPVDNIDDVVAAFDKPIGGFHVVKARPLGGQSELVLDAATYAEAHRRILSAYQVPQAWRASPAPPALGPPCEPDGETPPPPARP